MSGFCVFLVGCERSGTTLIRTMLGSHSELTIPGESYFIRHLEKRRKNYERSGAFDMDAFLADLEAHEWFSRWGLPVGDVRAVSAAAPPRDFPQAIRQVFEAYARHKGKSLYGDKTPRYVMDLPLLARLFPEAHFVHIIRDGRDVALSLIDRLHRPPDTVAAAARFWRCRVRSGRRAGQRLGPDRYLEIRYDDLVDEPRRTVSQVCDFIGIAFEEGMLSYSAQAAEVVAGFDRPEYHRHLHSPPTKGIRNWREAMSPDDQALFSLVAGDMLAELGYEGSPRASSVSQRIRVRRHWLGAEAARSASFGRQAVRRCGALLSASAARIRAVRGAPLPR